MGIRGGSSLSRLTSLQGTVIPEFYGSGNVVLPENTRGIRLLAIIMEYIQGTPLADIEAGKANTPPAIFRPLLDAVKGLETSAYSVPTSTIMKLFSHPKRLRERFSLNLI
jgi:hypothetical protein